MMDIYLNRVAVWKAVLVDGINKRPSQEGVSYLTKDSTVYKQAKGRLIRFVKNYEATLDGKTIKYSLFVRTDRTDDENVEKELDKIATELNPEYIDHSIKNATITSFVYTDFYIKDAKGEE